MAQNKVKAIARTSLAGSSVSSSYQALNASGLGAACFKIAIYNTTNTALDVSYDGTTDNDVVPANSFIEIMSQTNAVLNSNVALFPSNTVVYVKGSAGSGNIYLSGYYVSQS